MDNARYFIQAYTQAPWRKQLQFIGLFLLILVIIAALGLTYLYVTALASTTGREIQRLQRQIRAIRQDIANKESLIASLTSAEEMMRRASHMDLQPITSEELVYIPVAGYEEQRSTIVTPIAQSSSITGPILSPEYRQSLIDWFKSKMDELEPLYDVVGTNTTK